MQARSLNPPLSPDSLPQSWGRVREGAEGRGAGGEGRPRRRTRGRNAASRRPSGSVRYSQGRRSSSRSSDSNWRTREASADALARASARGGLAVKRASDRAAPMVVSRLASFSRMSHSTARSPGAAPAQCSNTAASVSATSSVRSPLKGGWNTPTGSSPKNTG